jgi:predicted esterase
MDLRPRRLLPIAFALMVIDPASIAFGREGPTVNARYELGRRVRAFEASFAAVLGDGPARARSAPLLNRAVRSFFALALPESGRALTEAVAALRGVEPLDGGSAWAASLAMAPASRFLDASATALQVRALPFYRAQDTVPAGATIKITLGDQAASREFGTVEAKVEELPTTLVVPLMGLTEGDHRLRAVVAIDGRESATQTQVISVVTRREERLASARGAIEAWPSSPRPTTLKASSRFLLDQLSKLAEGATLELDVPAAARLAELEAMIKSDAAGQAFFGVDRPGDFWMALAPEGSRLTVPARLLVPTGLDRDGPRPLVVAMHGAGGSENLFFESYGHGAIVDECRRRGWLLVSPRSLLAPKDVPALVDEVARLVPVDRRRVALVGHSMGAAQAVAAASAAPDRYTALVALGGGGRVVPSDLLRDVPTFVGVGKQDFALEGARGLVRSLKAADVREVHDHEYEDVEHLAIVQVALPDVFAWLDARWRVGPER